MSKITTVFVMAAACSALPSASLASASGSCSIGAKKLTVADGMIYRSKRYADKTNVPTITLTDFKLDERVARVDNPQAAISAQRVDLDGGMVLFMLGADGVILLNAMSADIGFSEVPTSGSIGELKLSRNDATGAAGHYTFAGKSEGETVYCDLTFDLAYAKRK